MSCEMVCGFCQQLRSAKGCCCCCCDRFNLRSEMSVLGIHKSPLGGIVSATIPVPVGESVGMGCVGFTAGAAWS